MKEYCIDRIDILCCFFARQALPYPWKNFLTLIKSEKGTFKLYYKKHLKINT